MRNILVILSLVVLITGCVNVGPTRFPEPSANFAPKRAYPVALSKAVEKVERTLDDARIPIANENKSDSSARIQTDYIEGESVLVGGFLAAQSTRYRYHVTLRPDGDKTALNVVCNVESTVNSGRGSSQWTDVTSQNAKLVTRLESWLYEQIEKNL